MKCSDYYFQVYQDDGEYSDPDDYDGEYPFWFVIVDRDHYDRTGCLNDDTGKQLNKSLKKFGFGEAMESTYEYRGGHTDGREKLLQLGFIEKIDLR